MRYMLLISMLICMAALTALSTADVVINEFELSPPDNATIWAELYNNGNNSVSIGGWQVIFQDEAWQGPIPVAIETIIAPGEFFVVEGQSAWLGHTNATVLLVDQNNTEMDRTPQRNDESTDNFTWGRIIDGRDTGRDADWAWMMGTKGRPNNSGLIKA